MGSSKAETNPHHCHPTETKPSTHTSLVVVLVVLIILIATVAVTMLYLQRKKQARITHDLQDIMQHYRPLSEPQGPDASSSLI